MATTKRFSFLLAFLSYPIVNRAPPVALDHRAAPIPPLIIANGGVRTLLPLPTTTIPIPTTAFQEQIVTSYIRPLTTSTHTSPSLPSVTLPSVSFTSSAHSNASRHHRLSLRQPSNSSSYSYATTITLICHTTLSPFAPALIPITTCHQSITFSSEHGYSLIPPNATALLLANATTLPSNRTDTEHRLQPRAAAAAASGDVETLTTYYVASWNVSSAGAVPTGSVVVKVCNQGGCETRTEVWSVSPSVVVGPRVSSLEFESAVTGPATVIIDPEFPTIVIAGAETTTLEFSTPIETTWTSSNVVIENAYVSTGGSAATSALRLGQEGDEGGGVGITLSRAKTSMMTVLMSGAARSTAVGTGGGM